MEAAMMLQSAMVVLGVFAFVGFVLWLMAAHIRAKIRHRTEVQKELIAKFASAEELSAFLNSNAGKLLLNATKDEPPQWKPPPPRPVDEQIGIALGWGVIVLAVGGAVVLVQGVTLPGAVLTALGAALLFNALLRLGFLLLKKRTA